MELGYFAACLPNLPLDKNVIWASENGFKMLELPCWPQKHEGREYSGATINAAGLKSGQAKSIRKLFDDNKTGISSLGYYEDFLSPDKAEQNKRIAHLKKVIDAAALLEVELVGTFIGCRPGWTPDKNLKEAGKIFRKIMKYANSRQVRLMLENCPMTGWQIKGVPGNLAYSPELWDRLFEEIDDENFGLNIDPSHLYWLNIDYIDVLTDYAEKIFHVHAKDTEIIDEGCYKYGIYSRQLEKREGARSWWRYRIPGLGEIDWNLFISTLYETGYDFVISIEHEDPVWEGTDQKIKNGLLFGKKHLSNFII